MLPRYALKRSALSLMTPNFAMSGNDVTLVMQPQWVLDHLQFDLPPSVANSRLAFTPHNAVAMQLNNHDQWLPRFVFDVAYGCAALKAWGAGEFVQFAEEQTKEFYYRDVDYDNSDEDAGVHMKKAVRLKGAIRHSRTETLEKVGDGQAVGVLDVVAGLWMHNARKDMHRGRMMKESKLGRAFGNGFNPQRSWWQSTIA